jgi:hypothetical protein
MGIREAINQNSPVTKSVAACIIVLALLFAFSRTHRRTMRSAADGQIPQAFFSDDDGKTFFVADMTNVPPFDHDGKIACRAEVFVCKGRGPFVGYLEKYDDAARTRIAAMIQGDPQLHGPGMFAFDLPPMVKKPGAAQWVGTDSHNEMHRVMMVKCPDGSVPKAMSVTDYK